MENKKSRRKWAMLMFAVTLIVAPVTMGSLSAFADEPSLDDKKQFALSFIHQTISF